MGSYSRGRSVARNITSTVQQAPFQETCLHVSDVFFTHDSIGSSFSHGMHAGHNIKALAFDLIKAQLDPSWENPLPSICLDVVEYKGRMRSLGNRRLWALKQACDVLKVDLEVKVHILPLEKGVRDADGKDVLSKFRRSNSSIDNGESVNLRAHSRGISKNIFDSNMTDTRRTSSADIPRRSSEEDQGCILNKFLGQWLDQHNRSVSITVSNDGANTCNAVVQTPDASFIHKFIVYEHRGNIYCGDYVLETNSSTSCKLVWAPNAFHAICNDYMIWNRAPTRADTTNQSQYDVPRPSLLDSVSISSPPIRTASVEQYGLSIGTDGLTDLSLLLGHWIDAVNHNIIVTAGCRGCLDVRLSRCDGTNEFQCKLRVEKHGIRCGEYYLHSYRIVGGVLVCLAWIKGPQARQSRWVSPTEALHAEWQRCGIDFQ